MKILVLSIALSLSVGSLCTAGETSTLQAASNGVQVQLTSNMSYRYGSFGLLDLQINSNRVFPLQCLQAYDDFSYELRNDKGTAVPTNQRTLQRPPDDQLSSFQPMGFLPKGQPGCPKLVPPTKSWGYRVSLRALYGNLTRGKYRLLVKLKPRAYNIPAVQLPEVAFTVQ